jgi:hypothetical protein
MIDDDNQQDESTKEIQLDEALRFSGHAAYGGFLRGSQEGSKAGPRHGGIEA